MSVPPTVAPFAKSDSCPPRDCAADARQHTHGILRPSRAGPRPQCRGGIVGERTDDGDRAQSFGEGKEVSPVPEQDDGASCRIARRGEIRRRQRASPFTQRVAVAVRIAEEAERILCREDAPHGLVHQRLGDDAPPSPAAGSLVA